MNTWVVIRRVGAKIEYLVNETEWSPRQNHAHRFLIRNDAGVAAYRLGASVVRVAASVGRDPDGCGTCQRPMTEVEREAVERLHEAERAWYLLLGFTWMLDSTHGLRAHSVGPAEALAQGDA